MQLIRGMASPKRTGVDGGTFGELYKLYLSWIVFSVSPLVTERGIPFITFPNGLIMTGEA